MKKRDSKKTDRKVSFFTFRRKTLSIGVWGRGGINLHAEETWLIAFLDKLNPQVKVQDIFPSEGYVGKCEYLSKRGAESCEQRAHVGKVG